jgi:hypothetical protein
MLVPVFARQAEESKRRWKKAYIELPLLANPKIAGKKTTAVVLLSNLSFSCEDISLLPKIAVFLWPAT